MELEDNFERLSREVKNLSSRPSNEDLLNLYALYKQATEGDNQEEAPGGFDFKAAAKHQAWKNLEGKSRQEAMREYVQLAEKLISEHGKTE